MKLLIKKAKIFEFIVFTTLKSPLVVRNQKLGEQTIYDYLRMDFSRDDD